MLDSKVYRAAFVPVVFAIVVAAFALAERPRPIGTTLAPDAFDGRGAFRILSELARTYPRTRPGSAGDDALAERVERDLRAALEPEGEVSGSVRVERTTGETIDGEQRLTTVIGERPGLNRRRIVIVAHRDRAAEDDRGRLSGTAALLELARLYRGRPTRRSLVFVSTSGGTGGLAALRDLPEQLGGPVDAVLVIGDVATRREERPLVLPWSEHGGFAPMRLRRTVERALQLETDLDPGSPRALAQWARLAVPLTLTPQGALGGDGLSAVTIQASGERGPAPGAAVSRGQFQAFGRGTLRSISALDNGPDVPSGPREYVLFRGRVLPRWTVSLIAALLLLPALVASVDGLARVRRRHQRVAVWLRWLAAAAAPFALAALIARLLGLVGLVPSLPGPVDPAALPTETAAIVVLGLVVVLGFLARAPLARALGAPSMPHPDEVPGASAALGVALTVLGICVWALNPYTALLLVPAVHLWLLAAVPEVRLPRLALVGMVLAGLLPFALVASYYAGQFDLNLGELAWQCVVLLSGGTVGPLGALAWSAVLGCGVGALLLALRKPRVRDEGPSGGPPSTRGPLSYAGPGSLGGTESALRR